MVAYGLFYFPHFTNLYREKLSEADPGLKQTSKIKRFALLVKWLKDVRDLKMVYDSILQSKFQILVFIAIKLKLQQSEFPNIIYSLLLISLFIDL